MHAVTFVLPDEMADVSIAGLQSGLFLYLINPLPDDKFLSLVRRNAALCGNGLNHMGLTGQVIPIPNDIYVENKNHQPEAILQITRKAVIRLSF